MALLSSSLQLIFPHPFSNVDSLATAFSTSTAQNFSSFPYYPTSLKCAPRISLPVRNPRHFRIVASQLCTQESLTIDKHSLVVSEAVNDDELWSAARLRVRTFYQFNEAHGIEDHKRYLVEREYEALKERISGKRLGFRKVACINATLSSSQLLGSSGELCSSCKFSDNGEHRVVVGTLDLNQCLRLADEITGKKPEGLGADFLRAYLSNVCVAMELHRNGVGYALVMKSKKVAREWGITDLYSHVAIDNEAAKKLYMKSGFVYEGDEPAWQARFLGRPRRLLLWADLAAATSSL